MEVVTELATGVMAVRKAVKRGLEDALMSFAVRTFDALALVDLVELFVVLFSVFSAVLVVESTSCFPAMQAFEGNNCVFRFLLAIAELIKADAETVF